MKRGAKIRSGLGKSWDTWMGRAENWKNREQKAYRDHVENMQKLGKPIELSPDHHFHRPADWRVLAAEQAAEALKKSIERLQKAKEKRARSKQVRQAKTEKGVRFSTRA